MAESRTLVEVRQLDFERDIAPLKSFLAERDRTRLDHLEAAVRDGDAFAFVADESGTAVGWAVVHIAFRDDQDWDPPDDDTRNFQKDDNAYLENIEVTARARGGGVGSKLLQAAEEEARRRGKKHLWLHTSENNGLAHALFERQGWRLERHVYPEWKQGARTRVYRKDL